MTETREQAVQKMHANLIHGGDAESCVVCNNLATTLGWPEPLPAPVELTGELVKKIYNRYHVGAFCNWNAIAADIRQLLGVPGRESRVMTRNADE